MLPSGRTPSGHVAVAPVHAAPLRSSAVLDRLLHHAETVIIEGSSFRMKDRIET